MRRRAGSGVLEAGESGEAPPTARGRGPQGRSYAVTIPAAVTGGRGVRPPRPASPPPDPRAGGSEEARPPRLPSPKPDPRCPATWLWRCGRGGPVPGLRGPPGPPPQDLSARPPRPRCHGNRAGPGCGARPAGRLCACAATPRGRAEPQRSRKCGRGPASGSAVRTAPPPSPREAREPLCARFLVGGAAVVPPGGAESPSLYRARLFAQRHLPPPPQPRSPMGAQPRRSDLRTQVLLRAGRVRTSRVWSQVGPPSEFTC